VFDEQKEEPSQEVSNFNCLSTRVFFQEIKHRAEYAEKLLNEWLNPKSLKANRKLGFLIKKIFNCFQHIPLNRQLAFVLIDALTKKILPPDPEAALRQLHSNLQNE
jgi:hypothetical protein